jgi:hypothetical protein
MSKNILVWMYGNLDGLATNGRIMFSSRPRLNRETHRTRVQTIDPAVSAATRSDHWNPDRKQVRFTTVETRYKQLPTPLARFS